MEERNRAYLSNRDHFDASMLSEGYENKSSLARYKELQKTFPNVLIIFENGEYDYGFDETAVALSILFGYRYYLKEGMLVVKIKKTKFEEYLIVKRQMRGFRYLVDRNGKLTFEKGTKKFRLAKPLSAYKSDLNRKQKKELATSYWDDPITKHGGGWYDDAWTPGLPSSRMYRKKSRSK